MPDTPLHDLAPGDRFYTEDSHFGLEPYRHYTVRRHGGTGMNGEAVTYLEGTHLTVPSTYAVHTV